MFPRLTSNLNRLFKIQNCYTCPICNYYGRLKSIKPESGERKNAKCPQCGALERHRLQYLVFKESLREKEPRNKKMLHFAPEDFFRNIFKNSFKEYITADLNMKNVDRKEDLTKLSFSDNYFDFIHASHVLEHIKDDLSALSEIKRVLRPNGMAIIPVPILGKNTIEYNEPNPHESNHVRCPGEDYYERYKAFFTTVKLYRSTDFDEKYQVYVYEDRSKWPSTMPQRPSSPGERHVVIVPVCIK